MNPQKTACNLHLAVEIPAEPFVMSTIILLLKRVTTAPVVPNRSYKPGQGVPAQ
jgi:hypothetical protein